uniref:Uncharacterized protein ycf23 n=1 Tax=Polysiphonia sertularioides TaxID=945028 RepID=A0A1Z1MGA9_9FLOR|nr:hypothetical protein [Polysiphonia sertularioides]
MNLFNDRLKQAFKNRSVLKVITGIENTKISQIVKIAEASKLAGVTYLDVSANVKIVKALKSSYDLPVCVSSINPVDIYNCVVSGADIVEIGNYDVFYREGIYITVEQIIGLFKEVKSLIPNIDICVTIPYFLTCTEQINLTKSLDLLGVNIIQTEGMSNVKYIKPNTNKCNKDLVCLPNSFIPSLFSTNILSNITKVPILASSGFKNINSPITKLYGASGVGISSALKQYDSISDIVKYIIQTTGSLNITDSIQSIDTPETQNDSKLRSYPLIKR